MQLSKRLSALADMVTPGSVLVDVGCDHGYISIYLVEKQQIPQAIAMDVVQGPLKRAQENIKLHGLEKYIETRLSDGLEALNQGECDTILISGMGGPLIEKILTEGMAVAEGVKELICQPQSDIGHFRKFLMKAEFEIVEENMILEDGKYYPMMKIRKNKAAYNNMELQYGPCLLSEKHPVLKDYLEKEQIKIEQLIQHLQNQSGEGACLRLEQLQEENSLIKEVLGVYEL